MGPVEEFQFISLPSPLPPPEPDLVPSLILRQNLADLHPMQAEADDYIHSRGNRIPIPAERAAIDSEVASNEEILSTLRVQLRLRTQRRFAALESVESKKEQLGQAKFCLSSAIELRDTLMNSAARLESTRQGIENRLATMALEDTGEHLSTQLLGVSAILDHELCASLWIKGCVETLETAVLAAEEAVILIQEELASAETTERATSMMLRLLQRQITELEMANDSLWRGIGPIHHVPENVWRQIFSNMVQDAIQSILDSRGEAWDLRNAAFILSSVCRNWRSISLGQHSIWRYICLSTSRFSDSDADYISLFLRRKGHYDGELIIRGDGPMVPNQWEEFKATYPKTTRMRRITILTSHKNKFYAFTMANYFSISEDLYIQGDETRATTISSSHTMLLGVTSLHLYSCLLINSGMEILPLALTSLTLHNPPTSSSISFHDCFHRSYPTIQFLSINANLESGSLTWDGQKHLLPSLTSLEVTFAQLNAEVIPFYLTPALRSLKILHFGDGEGCLDQWGQDDGFGASVERLTIAADQHANRKILRAFKAMVLRLTSMMDLQIEGGSAEQYLQSITEGIKRTSSGVPHPIPKLRMITIRSYQGTGESIAKLVRAQLDYFEQRDDLLESRMPLRVHLKIAPRFHSPLNA
ncbi:hypothetical protein FRC18_003293 [Serendipita sp. 400]|nr:hypothetical protein FRC18_003293 [Serendipita sp. 400]